MTALQESISKMVWESKYRYQQAGRIIDQSIEDTWRRVAKAIAQAEKPAEQPAWEKAFYQILQDFRFLPGGRILAGAGTQHEVTLFNCFVMDIACDSLSGIFHALEEGALTLQQGGGVGYDFSVLRPYGSVVKKTGIHASGPVSFMRIWDTMCSVLLSTGARRGAMMGVLRCDHPDIETFITAKENPRELRHFNVSVMVSDEFMTAVKNDEGWTLVFPVDVEAEKCRTETNSSEASSSETSNSKRSDVENDIEKNNIKQVAQEQVEIVYKQWGNSSQPLPCKVYRKIKARELWEKIIRSAYTYAEPGVLFSDTINRRNNLWYCEHINATNPCGEIPLPSYGACDLGSINLTQFVFCAFTSRATINWKDLEETVKIATRFLDNVITVSRYPLTAQRLQAENTRRIGLGVTGLADVFVMMGLRYGDAASLKLAKEIMQRISHITWQTSIELAREKGSFPLYTKEYLQGEFVLSLDSSLQRDIEKFGVRNSHHNTIAPTGTISLLANNVSNGIEPIFSAVYDRHVRMTEGEMETMRVRDYAYQLWRGQEQGQGQELENTSSGNVSSENTMNAMLENEASKNIFNKKFPLNWVDANSLTPQDHLNVQAAMQPYIDNAISKTINIPEDFPFENLSEVYTQAYALGLKGCTVFRPNPVTGSILEVPEEHCCQFDGKI
jgi:ribonucleoside-diphosphate reductase alpha chain